MKESYQMGENDIADFNSRLVLRFATHEVAEIR